MNKVTGDTNNHTFFDIDVCNKEQQPLWQAEQKYIQQLKSYFDLCYHIIKRNLESTISISNIERTNKEVIKHSIFRNTRLFVLDRNKDIHCINDLELIFNKSNYQDIFKKLGYYIPPAELINNLYEILHFRKITKPYYNYFKYKLQNKCSEFIFDHFELFKNIDGNILFNKGTSVLEKNLMLFLYEKTYKYPVHTNNYASKLNNKLFIKLKQPTVIQFKTIIDYLRNSPLETEPTKKHSEEVLLQHIIFYLQQNHQLTKQILTMPPQDPISAVLLNEEARYMLNFLVINAKNLSNKFIKQLYLISNGSKNVINQLAMMIARINLNPMKSKCTTCIPPKITIILTSNIDIVKSFLDQLYPEELKNYKNIHNLCSKEAIIENILFKYNGGILQVYEHSKSISPANLKIIKKFVKSIPIHIPDKAVGNVTYISNCHYVVLAKNQEEVILYKNYFQNLSEVIVLNNSKTENNTLLEKVNTTTHCNTTTQQTIFPNLGEFDYKWVHTIFATYGLLLLTDKKTIRSKKQPSLDPHTVVSSFLNECCTLKGDCYSDDLYGFYKNYFMKKYGVEPIKKIHLVNILKIAGTYTYCRLRHHAKDNRWGFKGISIKNEKLEEYSTSEIIPKSDQIEFKIANYLSEINEQIGPLIGIE